ncbi:unnamed protein product, partial [Iphiclides podalirius]
MYLTCLETFILRLGFHKSMFWRTQTVNYLLHMEVYWQCSKQYISAFQLSVYRYLRINISTLLTKLSSTVKSLPTLSLQSEKCYTMTDFKKK